MEHSCGPEKRDRAWKNLPPCPSRFGFQIGMKSSNYLAGFAARSWAEGAGGPENSFPGVAAAFEQKGRKRAASQLAVRILSATPADLN